MLNRIYSITQFNDAELTKWKAPAEVLRCRKKLAAQGSTLAEADRITATHIELVDKYYKYSYRSFFN